MQVSQTRHLVYNLSSKNLNAMTTKILYLGPKFVLPENKFDTLNDKIEIENKLLAIQTVKFKFGLNKILLQKRLKNFV